MACNACARQHHAAVQTSAGVVMHVDIARVWTIWGAGTDSAYSSPTGKDTDSAFQLALGEAPAISAAWSPPSDTSVLDLPVAAATPAISDARPRPPSAGQPSGYKMAPLSVRVMSS